MQGDHASVSVNRKPMGSDVVANTNPHSASPLLIRRVVAALEAGEGEKNIAAAEHISERMVRRIRKYELDRRHRHMNAVGTAVGGMLDNIRHLHREIDESITAEILEGAA